MSARATWKGLLKIALVQIPIKVFPATESSESIAFNQLHSDCKSRMQQKRWCPSCKREVPAAEIVKGFEFEKGKYVLLLDAELDAVHTPSTRMIDLTHFAEVSALDPLHIDRSYYLAPDGPLAGDAYVLMTAAMTGRVGIGKLAIYGREYLVAVRPQVVVSTVARPLLLLHTLHHAVEIRAADMTGEVPTFTRSSADHLRVARQVIEALAGPLNLAAFTDAYQADVRRIIDAKIAGKEIVIPAGQPAADTLSLQDALTQSLLTLVAAKRKPAKAALPAPVATRKRA